jgi:hypothetical protein
MRTAPELAIRLLEAADWPAVREIYAAGLATGDATFEEEPPSWGYFDGHRLPTLRVADAWHCFGDASVLRRKWEIVAEAARRAGRDPSRITRASSVSISGDLEVAGREVEAQRDAGTSYLICGWPAEGAGRVEDFAQAMAVGE